MTCKKYGCNYELDLDGQVTCSVCGAMDDDRQPVNFDEPFKVACSKCLKLFIKANDEPFICLICSQ